MFGLNAVVNPHNFDDAPTDSLMVTTIFPTLQGEGPFSGCPASFIRLTKCNLKCSFCDTFFDAGSFLTFSQILEKVEESWDAFHLNNGSMRVHFGQKPILVITGGEPLLQPNLEDFCAYALGQGYKIQIETNGMFFRSLHKSVHVVVSPKCNETTREYIKPEAMLHRADSLKFVISADEPGYQDIPDFAKKWLSVYQPYGKQIFLSPMNCYIEKPVQLGKDGTIEQRAENDERFSFWTPGLLDMERNRRNHEYAALLCMKYGLRLSLQTHLLASLP